VLPVQMMHRFVFVLIISLLACLMMFRTDSTLIRMVFLKMSRYVLVGLDVVVPDVENAQESHLVDQVFDLRRVGDVAFDCVGMLS
jgi:hypothetical protein